MCRLSYEVPQLLNLHLVSREANLSQTRESMLEVSVTVFDRILKRSVSTSDSNSAVQLWRTSP